MKKIFAIQLVLLYLDNVLSQSSTSRPSGCISKYGNPLNGTCMQVDDCTGAALEGSCSSGLICCVADKAPISVTEDKIITKNRFYKFVNKTRRNEALYGFFIKSLEQIGAKGNIYKTAAYFSQLIGESNYFKNLESRVIDSDSNTDLGNNMTGDGKFYQGRGAILLRGRKNYALANSISN